MSRRVAHVAAAILLAALLFSVAVPARAATSAPRTVVVVLAPYLSWNDVESSAMPRLRALAGRSTLADVAFGEGAPAGATAAEQGAAALSAGGSFRYVAGSYGAADATEPVAGAAARDLYRQLFTQDPGDAGVLYLGRPQEMRAQATAGATSVLGALGAAAHVHGARTVAIGCSDSGANATDVRSRPAAILAADETGRVDAGDVSGSTLVTDPRAPSGLRSSPAAILAAYDTATRGTPSALVVIDPGDLERAASLASRGAPSAAAPAHRAAVTCLDAVVGGLLDRLGPRDVMVVVGQVPPAGGVTGVLVMGAGGFGIGTSGSTHRAGLVTAGDVSDSIAGLLGSPASGLIAGTALSHARVGAAVSFAAATAFLDRLDRTSAAVGAVRDVTVNVYIVVALLVLGLGTAAVLRRRALPGWTGLLLRAILLALLCVLAGSVLEFAVVPSPSSGAAVVGAMLAVAGALLVLALLAGVRTAQAALLVVAGSIVATLLVDQWAGAPLSLAQVFGYSPAVGGRFYGLGNEMAGLLMGSVLVVLAIVLDDWRDAGWGHTARAWGWPIAGAVTLLTAAAPFWGANVGPVVWMTAGFLAGWSVLRGRRIWTWRNLVVLVLIVVVVVAGLAAVDLAAGSRAETHLARAVAGAETGGPGTLVSLVVRKAEASLSVFGASAWSWVMVAILAALSWLRWRPRGRFAAMLAARPAFSAAFAAALFASFATLLTEDSGIIVPAFILVPICVATLFLMLAERGARPALVRASVEGGAA